MLEYVSGISLAIWISPFLRVVERSGAIEKGKHRPQEVVSAVGRKRGRSLVLLINFTIEH